MPEAKKFALEDLLHGNFHSFCFWNDVIFIDLETHKKKILSLIYISNIHPDIVLKINSINIKIWLYGCL